MKGCHRDNCFAYQTCCVPSGNCQLNGLHDCSCGHLQRGKATEKGTEKGTVRGKTETDDETSAGSEQSQVEVAVDCKAVQDDDGSDEGLYSKFKLLTGGQAGVARHVDRDPNDKTMTKKSPKSRGEDRKQTVRTKQTPAKQKANASTPGTPTY